MVERPPLACGGPRRISIVITNYNFGSYVGEAISSALEPRWADKEIIVVDDGSTDDSRAVIESFGDSVQRLYKANGGQPSATNVAFPLITGDIVFFLDSDDLLLPRAAEVVVATWDDKTVKVQFPSILIDHAGSDTGKIWPHFHRPYAPELVRSALLRTARYPTSATSGNAFSYRFLEQLFPIPEDLKGFDSYVCMTAPFYGDVKTVTEPLGKFRIHGKNSWSQLEWQPDKLFFYIDQEFRRDAFVRDWAANLGLTVNPASLRSDYIHLMHRVGCKRIFPTAYPFPRDSMAALVGDGIKAVAADPFLGCKAKLVLAAWFVIAGLAPHRLALSAIKARHLPFKRPRIVQLVLSLTGAVRR
jgi:glycosyltransferase involved in cell wall biosynthesis